MRQLTLRVVRSHRAGRPARINRRLAVLVAILAGALGGSCGGSSGPAAPPEYPVRELVRVRVSVMTGMEPGTIDSSTHPGLFVLDPSISSASLTFDNPLDPRKVDTTPATWRPSLAPVPPAVVAGTITLRIISMGTTPRSYTRIMFTTSAQFASNPSSLRLHTSRDAFASTLATMLTDVEHTLDTPVPGPSSFPDIVFRWTAANDGGEMGGGSVGFSTGDITVYGPAP